LIAISVLEFHDYCLLCGCLHYPTLIPLIENRKIGLSTAAAAAALNLGQPRTGQQPDSPGSAASPDLSGWTGTFISIDTRRHLLTENGTALTDCRYLVVEKGGISTHEPPSFCWRKAASRRVVFLGFSPLVLAVRWALWPAWPYRRGRREFKHLHYHPQWRQKESPCSGGFGGGSGGRTLEEAWRQAALIFGDAVAPEGA